MTSNWNCWVNHSLLIGPANQYIRVQMSYNPQFLYYPFLQSNSQGQKDKQGWLQRVYTLINKSKAGLVMGYQTGFDGEFVILMELRGSTILYGGYNKPYEKPQKVLGSIPSLPALQQPTNFIHLNKKWITRILWFLHVYTSEARQSNKNTLLD